MKLASVRSPSLLTRKVFRWSWSKTRPNGFVTIAQFQPRRRNAIGKVIRLHLSVFSLPLQCCRQRSALMTPPWPHLRKKSTVSRQESIALFRNKQKSNLRLNANVTSPSPLFPIICSMQNFDELNIQSLSLTPWRVRKHQHRHLVPYLSLLLVLRLTLVHHLVPYLSLPLVLRVRLVCPANVLGQGRTLNVRFLTRCLFTYIVFAVLCLLSFFAHIFHPSDLFVVGRVTPFFCLRFDLCYQPCATRFVSSLSCSFTHLTWSF